MDNNKLKQKRVKAIKPTNKRNNKSNKIGSKQKIKIKKTVNNRNMNKIHISMHSPKIEFTHQQLYPEKHFGNLIPIPMCPIPLHYRGISYRSSLNCGTNGNAMIASSPEHLVRFLNSSTASSFYTITGIDYQPNSLSSYNASSLTKVVDAGITSNSGLNITNSFERTKLVSFSIEFSITGVSNLSRKGNLYLADEWSGDFAALNSQAVDSPGTATNYTNAQQIANSYPISTIIKMPHVTKELSTSNDVKLRWVWTPTQDLVYTSFTVPEIHTNASQFNPLNGSANSFIFIAQGCDPTTVINYEIHCIFGADVDASLTNTFPVTKSNIFSYTQESLLSAMSNNQKFRVISNYNWRSQSFNILNTTNNNSKILQGNMLHSDLNNLKQDDITAEKLLILRRNVTPIAFKNWIKQHENLINIDIINKYSQLYDEQAINKQIEKEKNNKQLHLPGYNYLGPGTKIATNIINGKKPVNHLDELARRHDLDYLDGTKSREEADEIMLRDLKLPIKPIVKVGLMLGRKFNIGNKNINNQDETDAYLALTKIKKGEIKKI